MRRLLNIPYVHSIFVQAKGSQVLDRAEDEVRKLLRQRQHLEAGRLDTFTVQNPTTILQTERETAHAMKMLIGSVAGIALVVGGIGILAVMLISIRERIHEIGLRRAVGARRRDIQMQFILEAALLAGIGGLLGIFTGIVVTYSVSVFSALTPVFSWPAAFLGFGFSIGTGLLFGIYPAWRAARLEPIEALRAT